MAARQVRIRVDFSDFIRENDENNIPKICWMLVDQNSTPSIKVLKANIKDRFLNNIETHFDLYLLGALLPDFESIYVIRDEDFVRLTQVSNVKSPKKRKRQAESIDQKNGIEQLESSPHSTENTDILSEPKNQKKRRKKKEHDDLPFTECELPTTQTVQPIQVLENQAKKESTDACMQATVDSENFHTHSVKTVEELVFASNDLDTSENFQNSSSGKKKKRIRKRKRRSSIRIYEIESNVSSHNTPSTSEIVFQNRAEGEMEFNSKKHIHFSDNDGDEITDRIPITRNGYSTDSQKTAVNDLKVKQTVLPSYDVAFEEVCKNLLRKAETESQENTSVFIVNCAETKSPSCAAQALKPATVQSETEYQNLPPLKGPPRPGDFIAYRVLELSEKFIPELSPYKEAVVKEVDHNSDFVTLEVKVGKVQRVLKGESGFDTVVQEDVRNVSNPSEKIVKVQKSHMHEIKIITPKE